MRMKVFIIGLILVGFLAVVVILGADFNKEGKISNATNTWERVSIDEDINGAHNIVAYDIDGNGKLDLVFAAYRADSVGWYENLGNPNKSESWARHTIDSSVGGSSYGAHYIAVADINKDDRPDLVVASGSGHTIVWYEAPKDPRKVVDWRKHVIATLPGNSCPYSVDVGDIDRDGVVDVACTDKWEHKVMWYKNCGNNKWKEFLIDRDLEGAFNVKIADINKDGRVDLVATGTYGNEICWYRAPIDPTDISGWKKIVLWKGDRSNLTEFLAKRMRPARFRPYFKKLMKNCPGPLAVNDLYNEGKSNIIVGLQASNKVIWLENPYPKESENPALWLLHEIGTVGGPRAIAIGDIDLDGYIDVAAVGEDDDTAYWFKSRGKHNTWERHVIDDRGVNGYLDWAHDIALCDLEGNGKLDAVVAAANGGDVGSRGGTFQWYINPIIPKHGNQKALHNQVH